MLSKHHLFLAFLLALSAFCPPSHGDDATRNLDGLVTITPEQTSEILANPGMGWETLNARIDMTGGFRLDSIETLLPSLGLG